MDTQQIQDMITDLREVRAEITRVNEISRVSGVSDGPIFNPAATSALNASIRALVEALA